MMTNVSGNAELAGVISNPQPGNLIHSLKMYRYIFSLSSTGIFSYITQGQKRKGRGKTKGFSIQKKRKESDNGKLKVIIPPDRTVAVGPGANDFVTEISVKKWKEVPDLSKDRIVAHILVITLCSPIFDNF